MSVGDLFPDEVTTQYVVIADVLRPDGSRALRIASGDASGDTLPWWSLEGLIGAAQQVCAAAEFEPGDQT